jgi:phage shock protein E
MPDHSYGAAQQTVFLKSTPPFDFAAFVRLEESVNRRQIISAAFLLALVLGACGTDRGDGSTSGVTVPVVGGGTYIDILPVKLSEMLASKDFLLVNVHVPDEGEIPGTDIHIPFDVIGQRTAEMPDSKDARIVLYCRSGSMSGIAARELVQLGYSGIYNLDGGYRAWIEAGYEFDG